MMPTGIQSLGYILWILYAMIVFVIVYVGLFGELIHRHGKKKLDLTDKTE